MWTMISKRKIRRDRGRSNSIKWSKAQLYFEKIERDLSNCLRRDMMFSMSSWGGSRCPQCGLHLPSKALLNRILTVGPTIYSQTYIGPCRLVRNCQMDSTGSKDWTFIGSPEAHLVPDWKLKLMRDGV